MIRKILKKLIVSIFSLCFCFICFSQVFATGLNFIDVSSYIRVVYNQNFNFFALKGTMTGESEFFKFSVNVTYLQNLYKEVKTECDRMCHDQPNYVYYLAMLNMLEQIALDNNFELDSSSTTKDEEGNIRVRVPIKTFLLLPDQDDRKIEVSSYLRTYKRFQYNFVNFYNDVFLIDHEQGSILDQEDIYSVKVRDVQNLYNKINCLLQEEGLVPEVELLVKLAKNMVEQISIEQNFELECDLSYVN